MDETGRQIEIEAVQVGVRLRVLEPLAMPAGGEEFLTPSGARMRWCRLRSAHTYLWERMVGMKSAAIFTDMLDFCWRVLAIQFGKARSIDDR